MEFATTTVSQNGQIVIPAQMRKDFGLQPKTKLLLVQEGDHIILKKAEPIYKKEFLESIQRAEADIKAGRTRTLTIPDNATAEDIEQLISEYVPK